MDQDRVKRDSKKPILDKHTHYLPEESRNILRKICGISEARWAAWLMLVSGSWEFYSYHGLSKPRLQILQNMLLNPKIGTWLGGSLSSGRLRWQSIKEYAKQLGCQRVYIFPHPENRNILLLGANQIDKNLLRSLKLLSESLSPHILPTPHQPDIQAPPPPQLILPEWQATFNPQTALDSVLQFLANQTPADAAYLAIHAGDFFYIQAVWNCILSSLPGEISIHESPPLEEIVLTRKGVILNSTDFQHMRLFFPPGNAAASWMGIPILLRQLVIGLAVFVSSRLNAFTSEHLEQAFTHANQFAGDIENAIVYAEATRYLQQLALLTELAITVSLSLEINEVARRIMQRLRREFSIDWAAVFLLTPSQNILREYGGEGRRPVPLELEVNNTLVGQSIITGRPVRVNNLNTEIKIQPTVPGLCSELAVPLKYQGRVIGAIDLMSKNYNSFSSQDEQLMVVIASHLAGFLENVRLTNEILERAQKLQHTVQQLQAIRETALDISASLDLNTLLTHIVHRAQSLVDARGGELGLLDEKNQVIQVVVSETPWENKHGVRIPLMEGIAGIMAVQGEPVVIRDYNTWNGRQMPERIAPFIAAAGIPLKAQDKVIGTLIVMDDRPDKIFKNEDVQLLELLAPQAVISIGNARLYQELQERIVAQQRAESNLIRSARLAAVGEMAASIAHELNNPLTTVTGFVEIALNDLGPESPLYKDLDLALQEALRARGVVRRLLDFTRPEEARRVKTDIHELIEQVLSLTRHMMRTNNVALQVLPVQNLPLISVDPNQIQQVLHNLIHNALQAMPQGGDLTIRTGLSNRDGTNWVTVQVIDTGVGIPEEYINRIFEPFFTTRADDKGTGLGLSVSYAILQSHGGLIEVVSHVDHGSCFTVYLPIRENDTGLGNGS